MANQYVLNYKYGNLPFISKFNEQHKKAPNDIGDEKFILNLKNFLIYAEKNIKFYKGINANICASNYSAFKKLPILKKKSIKDNFSDISCNSANLFNSISFQTSGTSGAPLSGRIYKSDIKKRFLRVLKAKNEFGIDFSLNYARFTNFSFYGNDIMLQDMINKHFFLSINDLSPETISSYADYISKYQIGIIEGYPSTIFSLVVLLKKNNISLSCVKHIITTAEKLTHEQKYEIENYFGCSIFDYYGSNEQSAFIKLTKAGYYVSDRIIAFIEILNSQNMLCKEGEEGRLIVTSFTSRALPLIRYDIGDRCKVKKVSYSKNGFPSYQIDEIVGREEDTLVLDNGKRVNIFYSTFKFLPEKIYASQILIDKKTKIAKLNYCSDSKIDKILFKKFSKNLYERIGLDYQIKLKHVDKLIPDKSGKVRAVYIK